MKKVYFIVTIVLFNYFVVSCERSSDGNAIFVDNTFKKVCAENKIPNEFVVKWKSGKISTVKNMSQHYFVTDFLENNSDRIIMAEPNYKLRLKPLTVTTKNTCQFKNWQHDDVKPFGLWENNHFGRGITIAVTDSGIDLENLGLINKIALNEGETGLDSEGNDKKINGIDDDRNGYVDDYLGYDFIEDDNYPNDTFGHGTAVSSIIANGSGDDEHKNQDTKFVKGIAPEVKIVPIKFIDAENGSTESAIQAIEYAISRDVDIINASWGGYDCSGILPQYLTSIEKENVLLVAASGNENLNLDDLGNQPPVYPASSNLKNQITVGSIAPLSKKRSAFSNYGSESVELYAPGSDIFSLGLKGSEMCLSGTSFAAPIISGSLALLMNAYPERNNQEIKKILLDSTKKDVFFKNLTQGKLSLDPLIASE